MLEAFNCKLMPCSTYFFTSLQPSTPWPSFRPCCALLLLRTGVRDMAHDLSLLRWQQFACKTQRAFVPSWPHSQLGKFWPWVQPCACYIIPYILQINNDQGYTVTDHDSTNIANSIALHAVTTSLLMAHAGLWPQLQFQLCWHSEEKEICDGRTIIKCSNAPPLPMLPSLPMLHPSQCYHPSQCSTPPNATTPIQAKWSKLSRPPFSLCDCMSWSVWEKFKGQAH